LLSEYGTKEPCNRFDIGNSIEFVMSDYIKSLGYYTEELPNSKRIDLSINGSYNLSIKYSSTGDITLHNSNSCVNKDCSFTDLLLLTPSKLYLLTNKNLEENKIDISMYLENKGDSLKLKRKLLKDLDRVKFPFSMSIDIGIDKKKCKNKLCSRLFYKMAMIEYEESKKC
jgi:hypothetical protein